MGSDGSDYGANGDFGYEAKKFGGDYDDYGDDGRS